MLDARCPMLNARCWTLEGHGPEILEIVGSTDDGEGSAKMVEWIAPTAILHGVPMRTPGVLMVIRRSCRAGSHGKRGIRRHHLASP